MVKQLPWDQWGQGGMAWEAPLDLVSATVLHFLGETRLGLAIPCFGMTNWKFLDQLVDRSNCTVVVQSSSKCSDGGSGRHWTSDIGGMEGDHGMEQYLGVPTFQDYASCNCNAQHSLLLMVFNLKKILRRRVGPPWAGGPYAMAYLAYWLIRPWKQ